jgi:hypothetical protein
MLNFFLIFEKDTIKEYKLQEQVVISEKLENYNYEVKNPSLDKLLLKSNTSDIEFNPAGLSISILGIPSKFTNVYIDENEIIGRKFETIDILTIPLNSVREIKFKGLDVYLRTHDNYANCFLKSNGGYGANLFYGNEKMKFKTSLSKDIFSYIKSYSIYNKFSFNKFSVSYIYNQRETPFNEIFSDFRAIFNFYKLNFQFYKHFYNFRGENINFNEEFFIKFQNDYKIVKNWGYFKIDYGFYNDYLKGNNLLNDVNFTRSLFSFEFYRIFLFKLGFENFEPHFNFEYKNFNLFLISRYPSAKELFMKFYYPELGYGVIGNSKLKSEKLIGINFNFWNFLLNYSKIFNYIGFYNLGYQNNLILWTYENLENIEVYSISFQRDFKIKDFIIECSFFIGKTPLDIPPYKFNLNVNYKILKIEFWSKAKTQLTPSLYSFDLEMKTKFITFKITDLLDKTSFVNLPYFTGRTFTIILEKNFKN